LNGEKSPAPGIHHGSGQLDAGDPDLMRSATSFQSVSGDFQAADQQVAVKAQNLVEQFLAESRS